MPPPKKPMPLQENVLLAEPESNPVMLVRLFALMLPKLLPELIALIKLPPLMDLSWTPKVLSLLVTNLARPALELWPLNAKLAEM